MTDAIALQRKRTYGKKMGIQRNGQNTYWTQCHLDRMLPEYIKMYQR